MPAALPDREMVFKGHVEEGKMENLPEILSFLPQIRYPILGGSALITFEDPEGRNNHFKSDILVLSMMASSCES